MSLFFLLIFCIKFINLFRFCLTKILVHVAWFIVVNNILTQKCNFHLYKPEFGWICSDRRSFGVCEFVWLCDRRFSNKSPQLSVNLFGFIFCVVCYRNIAQPLFVTSINIFSHINLTSSSFFFCTLLMLPLCTTNWPVIRLHPLITCRAKTVWSKKINIKTRTFTKLVFSLYLTLNDLYACC